MAVDLRSVALTLAMLSPAAAQVADSTQAIRFAPGQTSATVEAPLTGRDTALYTVAASKGQVLNVSLSSPSPAIYFNVYRPGDNPGAAEPLFRGETASGDSASLTLEADGDYTIQVYLYRNAAREGRKADYVLKVSVDGAAAAAASRAWVVSGVSSRLNLRSGPSTSAKVVGTVPPGARLEGFGCQTIESREWCKVRPTGGDAARAWVARDYLTGG